MSFEVVFFPSVWMYNPVTVIFCITYTTNADRMPASCSYKSHGHPPESLHRPGLLLRREDPVPQLSMAVEINTCINAQDMQNHNVAQIPPKNRFRRMSSTCPIPRCTQLQLHWEGWHALHPVPDSWLSDGGIRSGRREVWGICNPQGPVADSEGVLWRSKNCTV